MSVSAYLLSVRCRLSLPRRIKQQELNHLREQILKNVIPGADPDLYLRQLGSPRLQAAQIQSRHPEFKRSPWRWLFLFISVCGLLGLLWPLILKFSASCLLVSGSVFRISDATQAASVGIIGGADGPTAVYVTTAVPGFLRTLFFIVITILGFTGYVRFRHRKQK